jgi:hypothetical protein
MFYKLGVDGVFSDFPPKPWRREATRPSPHSPGEESQASCFFTRFWKLLRSFWILGGMIARQ